MQVYLDYPWWVFILGGSFWAALSFLFYRSDKRLQDFSKSLKLALAALRSIGLIIIFFLLLNPFLKAITSDVEKPLLAIAFDNSESVAIKSDSSSLKNLKLQFENELTQLQETYDIAIYRFGDQVDRENRLNFSFKISNPSNLKNELKANYTNRNLAGVVLVSDGIFNRGANANRLFDDLKAPFYTVGVGDTSIQEDLFLQQIRNNQIAYLGNDFLVEVAVGVDFLSGKSSKVTIFKDGEELQSKNLTFDNSRYFQKHIFTLPAKEKGLHQYTIKLSGVEGEQNFGNNSGSFFIDVIDASQRILMLADAPHPDVAAIRSALEKNQGNKVEVRLAKDFVNPIIWEDYNLIIFHQVPGKSNTQRWAKEIQALNVPTLTILGGAANLNFQNSLYSGVKILGNKGAKQEVFASLNQNFQHFSLNEEFTNLISRFPPLISPFGEYKTSNALQPLLFQKIGPVVTAHPLLGFEEISGKKVGYFTGEGIWRWRVFCFKETGSHKAFDEFIQKVTQFLALKEDKSRFKLIIDNSIFENERLTLEAELYDETYTLTTSGEISLNIKDSSGIEYPFKFFKSESKYVLDAGMYLPGNYTYQATAQLGNEKFTKSGTFTVKSLDLEKNNTRADFNLLANIAQNTGGEFYTSNTLGELFKDLKANDNAKPVIFNQEQFFELINLRWIFFLVLALFSIEWFIRKYKGAY